MRVCMCVRRPATGPTQEFIAMTPVTVMVREKAKAGKADKFI
jgi:hypothetical protein